MTSTSVPIVKCIKNSLIKSSHHEAYERESWSKRQYDKAQQNAQNDITIILSWYIPKVWKRDFNIRFYSKMYWKVCKQVLNQNFFDVTTIIFKYNVQQSRKAHRALYLH